MKRIEDVAAKCEGCELIHRFGDCEPDVDGDGSMGCPTPDCGRIIVFNDKTIIRGESA